MVTLGKSLSNKVKKFMPSTNQLLLVGVALLYVYTLAEGDKLPYFLFRCTALVLIIAWLWSAAVYSGIKYSSSMQVERSQVGQDFPLNIALVNSLPVFVPWLEVNIDIPQEFELIYGKRGQIISLGMKDQMTFAYKVRCLKRGFYKVGSARIRLGDVFGIFVRERVLKAERTIIVYPRIILFESLNIPSLRNLGNVGTIKSSDEDLTGPTGVRKYSYGDPLNRIHWKAAARTGQLQVKEYDLHTAPEVAIFLDLSMKAYLGLPDQVLETAITIAASLANHCYTKRLRYGLVSNGRQLFIQPSSRDVSQLLRTMEHLALANVGRSYSYARTILLESSNFLQGTTLLLVTPCIDAELAGILAILKQRGYSIAIIQVGDAPMVLDLPHSITYLPGINESNLARVLGGESNVERYKPRFG